MELLRCEHVTKEYGTGESRVIALKDVSLTIEKGSFTAVVGASGSGKSTLLHLFGAVDKPSEGKIWIDGTELSELTAKEAAIFRRRKVGLVYQFYNLIPTLTVESNILLPMRLDRRKPDSEYLEELLRTLDLQDKRKALPSQLSGGQQQRAAIARALLYRPALLLADEPTGNLDRKHAREVLELLKRANRERGQTILLITHDESAALETERIITLEDGRILSDEWR